MSISSSLRSSSATLQSWLHLGDVVDVVPGEESLTDLLLVSLSVLPGQPVRTIRLGTRDEASVGPDFVLWFISERDSGRVGVAMLVQAKRLYPSGRFEQLFVPGTTHPQLAVLSSVSAKWKIPALYALYLPTVPASGSRCNRVNGSCQMVGGQIHPSLHPQALCEYREDADCGVMLATLPDVESKLNEVGSRPSGSDIVPLSFPLACVADCRCIDPPAELGDGHETGPAAEDLVDRVTRRLQALELVMAEPQPVPGWLDELILSQPDVEARSIVRGTVLEDVDTVVVVQG